MKKLYSAFIVIIIILSCLASVCAEEEVETISNAISVLQDYWENEMYGESSMSERGYWEIKNTRIVGIKDLSTSENGASDKYAMELFGDVRYVVEFMLFTDYFGSAPYYSNIGIAESVAVKKDGTMEVVTKASLFNQYRTRTYSADYSSIIESVTDYNTEFNVVLYLLEK